MVNESFLLYDFPHYHMVDVQNVTSINIKSKKEFWNVVHTIAIYFAPPRRLCFHPGL